MSKNWRSIARPEQLMPEGDWDVWAMIAGRGWGKTRAAAEAVNEHARANPTARIALVGRITGDVRDIMVNGESGLLACSDDDFRPVYSPTERRVTWPNGAIATCFTAEKPDRLRGPQHSLAWAENVRHWKGSSIDCVPDAWAQLQFGMRLGAKPRIIVTTVPSPTLVIRELLASPTAVITRGLTADNVEGLAKVFLDKIAADRLGIPLSTG